MGTQVFLIRLTQVKRIRADAYLNVLYASESDSGGYDWVGSHSKNKDGFRVEEVNGLYSERPT